MALLITFLLGLFFVVGIVVIRLVNRQIVEHISISLAAGALIAMAVFDLIPEVIEGASEAGIIRQVVFVLLGILILKVLDTFVPEHDSHDETNDDSMIHIGVMSAVAITLHNIIEGMTVFNIAGRDILAGASLGVGVGLHNIPMGMLIYATLKRERGIKKYGLLGVTVVSTFIGGLLMMALSPFLTEAVLASFVCITLGMVIFIVLFELIPSILHSSKKITSVIFIVLGFAIVVLSSVFE